MAKMVQVIAAVRGDGFTRLDLSSTFSTQNMGESLGGLNTLSGVFMFR
ncbi:hypothetical protein [Shewanella xiamenensis]|nr:hypothetical protein [Shewanella xiamenensis]